MHPSDKITKENLKDVVYWHRPNAESIAKFERIAKASEEFMKTILENAPDCPDTQSALFQVRCARMLVNAAISLDPTSGMAIDHERKE